MNRSQVKIETYKLLEKLVGRNRLRKAYLKKCVKRYVKADCIFVHIPKAAGTSVANSVIGSRAGHFTSLEISNFMGKNAYSKYFSFAITRDPLTKLISAYNYVKNEGGSEGGVRTEKIFFGKEFRSFDSFVCEWLIYQDMDNTNLLFKPQNLFVLDFENEQNVDFLGKVEELEYVEKQLSIRLQKDIRFGNRNITRNSKPSNLDSTTLRLIQEIYQKDYEMFNY